MSVPTVIPSAPATARGHGRILVGFEGFHLRLDHGWLDAVDWAAAEAVVRGSSLRIVACSSSAPVDFDSYGLDTTEGQSLAEVVALVRQRHPNLTVEPAPPHLDSREALIEAATDADLVVVGVCERAPATAWLLGLVPTTAARRSASPVIVVRGGRPQPLRRIVVGVDGSSAAVAAIDWASVEAGRHGADLVVVHAWQPGGSSLRVRELARADAQCVVDLAVARGRRRTGGAVRGELIEGPPSAVLIQESGESDLLAVGSRGRSGFKTMLFGSVALFVAEHAGCPVAVTHPQLSRHERRDAQGLGASRPEPVTDGPTWVGRAGWIMGV